MTNSTPFPRTQRLSRSLSALALGVMIASFLGCAEYEAGSGQTPNEGGMLSAAGVSGEGGSAGSQAGGGASNAGSASGGTGGEAAGAATIGGAAPGGASGGPGAGGDASGGAASAGTSAGGMATGGASAGAPAAGAPTAGAPAVPQQLAVGKSATASSQEASHTPANGNDSSTTTRWCAIDGTFPQWWRVDLGAVHALSQASIRFELADRTYTYTIETSSDDAVYIQRIANTGTGAVQTVDFPAGISARYVRINVTNGTPVSVNGIGTWASFFDFSVTGT